MENGSGSYSVSLAERLPRTSLPANHLHLTSIRFEPLGAHQPQRLSGHDVRGANERFIQVQISGGDGLLLMADQSRDGAIC